MSIWVSNRNFPCSTQGCGNKWFLAVEIWNTDVVGIALLLPQVKHIYLVFIIIIIEYVWMNTCTGRPRKIWEWFFIMTFLMCTLLSFGCSFYCRMIENRKLRQCCFANIDRFVAIFRLLSQPTRIVWLMIPISSKSETLNESTWLYRGESVISVEGTS